MRAKILNLTEQTVFLQALQEMLVRSANADSPLGLLVIRLEDFDRVNMSLGYAAGNAMLASFAGHLQGIARDNDRVIRIGTSKFVLLLSGVMNPEHVVLAANKIIRTANLPQKFDGRSLATAVTIGIAIFPEHADSAESLLQRAEIALESARSGEMPYMLYSAQGGNESDLLGMENELDEALEEGQLELYYQPKIRISDLKPCGAEALMRWTSPLRGFVPPDVFIDLADKTGRIQALTWFALNTALRQASEWPDTWGALSVSVNVTPNIVDDADLVDLVKNAIGMWDTDPDRLIIEVTEGALITNPEKSLNILKGLRSHGVQVSIDDFGTGYSSLAYFKNIPANELKIDKAFVMNMFNDKADEQIVRSVIELAHIFNLGVVAEGVENQETVDILSKLNCDSIQGYFFSKPLPQSQFIAWLENYVPAKSAKEQVLGEHSKHLKRVNAKKGA